MFHFPEEVNLNGKRALVVGASRGIGEEIAKDLAKRGVRVALAATNMHAHLGGTTFDVATSIRAQGGIAHALTCNLAKPRQIPVMVDKAAELLGGIDYVIYVASALLPMTLEDMTKSPQDLMKKLPPMGPWSKFLMAARQWRRKLMKKESMAKWELTQAVNSTGAWLTFAAARAHLVASAKAGRNPHILTISPPYPIAPRWFGDMSLDTPNGFYAMCKQNMTLAMLANANALEGVAGNALWPEKITDTAATRSLERLIPGGNLIARSRKPAIMAHAVAVMVAQPSSYTGNTVLDRDVLSRAGVKNFDDYATVPGTPEHELVGDWFVD